MWWWGSGAKASDCLMLLSHSRHNDRAKKMTSPSMLLSLDRPSPPAAAAAATLLLLLLDAAAGDEELVAATPGPVSAEVMVNVNELSVAVLLAGESMRVTVKLAGFVDSAEVLGRTQVVVVEEEQSVPWATWSGLGFVSCAWAKKVVVVAPRAARMWRGRIGWWWWRLMGG